MLETSGNLPGFYAAPAEVVQKVRGILRPNETLLYLSTTWSSTRKFTSYWMVSNLRFGVIEVRRLRPPDTLYLVEAAEVDDISMSTQSEISKFNRPIVRLKSGRVLSMPDVEKGVTMHSQPVIAAMMNAADSEG